MRQLAIKGKGIQYSLVYALNIIIYVYSYYYNKNKK